MAKIQVAIGDKIPVSIKLEFEGTIRNHAVLIENQHIPTINNQRKDYEIALDGSPIQITARFIGVQGSTVKKFTLTINGKTETILSDAKLKREELEIRVIRDFRVFDLEEVIKVEQEEKVIS